MTLRRLSQLLTYSSSVFGLTLALSLGLLDNTVKAEMHPAVCARNMTEQTNILTEYQAYFYAGNPPTEQILSTLRRQPQFLRNLRSECPHYASYINALIRGNRDLLAYVDRYW